MAQTDRLSLPFENGTIEIPTDGSILVVNAQSCPAYDLLPKDRTTCLQDFFPTHDHLSKSGFNLSPEMGKRHTLAIVHLIRSRDENRAHIARAYGALAPEGILVIDGAKTDGIESQLKAVKKLLPVEGAISKAHGKVFWLEKSTQPNEFAVWSKALDPAQNADGYHTQAGIFSESKIDKGSLELVPHLAGKLKGVGADLGAGWGYLAQQALDANSAITNLNLIEAHVGALNCAKLNVTDERATFTWADATTLGANGTLDFVITNPPFHQSRKADPALGQRFIESAARLLKPTGKLFMVANRQLAYEATLDASFRNVERLSQSSQYKCFFARKPKL